MRSIKKIALLLLITTCLTLFTGCVRFNATINIKDNGRADVSILYATMEMDEDESNDISLSQDEIQDLQDEGWSVESYNKSGYTGYILRKENTPYNYFSDSFFSETTDTGEFLVTRSGFDYIIDWQLFDKDDMAEFSNYKEFIEMSEGYMTVTVTLPVVPKNTNATSVSGDGKTLEWNLLEESNVYIEYTLINKWYILAICLLVVVIIIIVIISTLNRKKRNEGEFDDYDYYDDYEDTDETIDEITYDYPRDNSYSVADEIMKLKKLLDDGAITQEEYDKQKQKLLDE